ncbi:hypothetical protein CDAR_58701 [Caerostris darwini]|uniref:C2H2-type domain-containing protein n=1 Tax=Caerostris darwini TaxID=1538125 RepID=A0AAV4S3M6_9ARAC|nr:hypothetical protein CDAR_58701 [Caerostris darwini]
MVLNQPLYAAVSTTASILVPCPYVAGGGLSPAAVSIPAGNMITNQSNTPESNSDSQEGNVISNVYCDAWNWECKPAESPTTFVEREKSLQKAYSCIENLNQERISPSDTSFLVKRRRITPATEASSASVARMSRRFKCHYCDYSSNKKTNLTLHFSVHRNSLVADELADSPFIPPFPDRYFTTCNIQFGLYENYQASFYE